MSDTCAPPARLRAKLVKRYATKRAELKRRIAEEQAAERPERLATQVVRALLVEQGDGAAGGGQLGRGDEPGEACPDDDHVGAKSPWLAPRARRCTPGWGHGTLTGAGEVIKLARPDVKIIATEPEAAQLLAQRVHGAAMSDGAAALGVLDRAVGDQVLELRERRRVLRRGVLRRVDKLCCVRIGSARAVSIR